VKKQIVVIGLGRFGFSVALNLVGLGQEVLVVDRKEHLVKQAAAVVTHAIQADATEIDTLRSLGVQNFDVGIVAIGGDVQSSILAALLLKELGIPYVIAKASNDLHAKVLEKIEVDRVVFPELEMGRRVAQSVLSNNYLDYIDLAKDYRLGELKAPPSFYGKTLRQLNLRSRRGVTVLLLKRAEEGGIIVSPDGDSPILPGDTMVVLGKDEVLNRWDDF
jgi:trk system potassium uptake protein TrkA